MHQPPGNLRFLLEQEPHEAHQIIHCYERPARYALKYPDVGRLHVGFSGILLEQLRDPEVVDLYRDILDIPAALAKYREATNIELIGMGYYHPIFPLIPTDDWADHLKRGRDIVEETFGRTPDGFWPPEMAFCMEMVPALDRAGYEYVVVDGVHVEPGTDAEEADPYRPYRATYDGHSITVLPRDRDISNAQESGLEPGWLADEITNKVSESPHPRDDRLVTTWSDGENGGWFRQMDEGEGFFGHFFAPYMERVRRGDFPATPVSLSGYLSDHPPAHEATVRTGAWNVGSTSGYDFEQWAGSAKQREAVEDVVEVSGRYWDLKEREDALSEAGRRHLEEGRRLVLEAETSCYLFWGESWLPRLGDKLEAARGELDKAEQSQTSSSSRIS